jgi:DNA-binding MarR family transcriptional regulator
LAALERDGTVRRHRGGRDRRRRLPDRWSIGRAAERDDRARAATQRLRPGQLDALVLDYIDSQGTDAVGATAIAKALGRSDGAVGNCLIRLAAAGRVRQVSDKARRYGSATAASSKSGRSRR